MRKKAFGRSVRSHAKRRFVIAMLLFGAGAFLLLWQGGGRLFVGDGEKEQYEKLLAPLVMTDPVAFRGPSDIPGAALCEMSLRAVLWADDGRDALLTDDSGRRIVPLATVEQKARDLFGEGVQLTPQSFGEGNAQYAYSEADSSFHIPLLAETGFYTPAVQGVRKQGKERLVLVGYVPAEGWSKKDDQWIAPSPTKFMTFTLSGKGDDCVVQSLTQSSEKSKGL